VLALGDDLLLVPGERKDAVMAELVAAAEVVRPGRAHLRAAMVTGPGIWSKRGLLGPLADQADRVARTRPWGLVDGLGELPPPLPSPSAPWRLGLLAAALWCGWGLMAARPAEAGAEAGTLSGEVLAFRDRRWLDFDVDDGSAALLFDVVDGDWRVRGDVGGGKAAWATGDGRYRVALEPGPGVLAEVAGRDLARSALAGVAPGDVDTLVARLRGVDSGVRVVRWGR
jgi:hypothetical protein